MNANIAMIVPINSANELKTNRGKANTKEKTVIKPNKTGNPYCNRFRTLADLPG